MKSTAENWHQPVFYLCAFMLLFAPLFRAANRPLPALILQALAIGLLLLLLWYPRRMQSVPKAYWSPALALLLLPLVYLLPLPETLLAQLPGRGLYAQVAASVGYAEWASLSLAPGMTEAALYALFPPLALFFAVYLLPENQVRVLVYMLVGMATAQALLGLLQYGAGTQSVFYLGNPYAASKSAAGTYVNRDHLAGMLAMVLPITLALLAAKIGHGGRSRKHWRGRIAFFSTIKGHQAILFGALAVLLLLGLVFTRSRAGVALAMLGLLFSLFAFARRLGGNNVYGTLGTVIAVALVLAVEIGLAPILDRFSHDPLQDSRLAIYSSSLHAIGQFFPFGAGSGAYPAVYPLFQPAELGHVFVNHAHNDYLEALFGQGVFALFLMLFGLMLYLRQWKRVWIKGRWGGFRFIQAGAGIGLLLMLMHAMLDFNLQIPANTLYFAFLAAVFTKDYKEIKRAARKKAGQPREEADRPLADEAAPQRAETGSLPEKVVEEQNPFLR